MSDFKIKPLRVDIRETSDGHSIRLNGAEFAANIERGSMVVGHDRKRDLATLTVTFIVDDLRWKGGWSGLKERPGRCGCELKALESLHEAGMTGTDATTSLDTFIRRVAAALAEEMSSMDASERQDWLAEKFGSDGVRAASVLTRAVSA